MVRYISFQALILISLVSCTMRAPSHLPESILDLMLSEKIEGDAATEIIDHLHMKSVAPSDSYIGRYRNDLHTATYYLSLYDDPAEAEAELDAMVSSMGLGGHVFDHVRQRTLNNREIYMALGMGQAHYFYSEENKLIWLAIDIPIAEKAISSLIN
jgi:hypothetical protein